MSSRRVALLETQIANLGKRVQHLEDRYARLAKDLDRATPAETPLAEAEERGPQGSWLFVRRTDFVPPEIGQRFDGLLAVMRTERGWTSRDAGWWRSVEDRHLVGWDWMLSPGAWAEGLDQSVGWAASMGCCAYCLNIEPHRDSARDWRGQHEELERYCASAREACDRVGLELWVTSWARPESAPLFPWLELLAPAHVAIPQCYEVHGRSGPDYVAECLDQYQERGARRVLLGRGAHVRASRWRWRTPDELAAHRSSTPVGYGEAWWPLASTPPERVVAAIVT